MAGEGGGRQCLAAGDGDRARRPILSHQSLRLALPYHSVRFMRLVCIISLLLLKFIVLLMFSVGHALLILLNCNLLLMLPGSNELLILPSCNLLLMSAMETISSMLAISNEALPSVRG